MKGSSTFIIAVIVMLLQLSIGCSAIEREISYQQQAKVAENNLDEIFNQLSSSHGAILLDRYNGSTGGQMGACDGRQIQVLFGTNELTFRNVLDFYGEYLPSRGWIPRTEYGIGRDFAKDKQYVFAVSNLYDVSMVKKTIVQDAKLKFKTLYLIELSTSVTKPLPSVCRSE